MSDIVLALDIGTSSVKAIAFDLEANAVPNMRAHQGYELISETPGAAVLDPDHLIDSIESVIQCVVKMSRDTAQRIRAVGVCSFWHSMLGVNNDGRAITPLYTWADTRAADASRELARCLDPDAVHRRTGCAIHTSYFPSRLLWLSQTQPEILAGVKRWLSPGEYLFIKLFGAASCSVSMASGTGLFDQNERRWDADVMSAVSVKSDTFSELTDIDQPVVGLIDAWAQKWPELNAVPWIPAIGDGAAGNIGSGCSDPSRAAINLGTSGAIRVVVPAARFEIPDDLWCYRLDGDHFVIGGAFSDGGNDLAWALQCLDLPNADTIALEMESRSPDAHGLTFLPFMAGERSVGWNVDARGTIHGLSTGTKPLDIVQAILEGVALRFALVADSLFREFSEIRTIVASGGAFARAPYWAQTISNAIGRPVTLTDDAEASSRGAAILALKSIGHLRERASAPPINGTIIEPNREHHKTLRNALDRQQDLHARLS